MGAALARREARLEGRPAGVEMGEYNLDEGRGDRAGDPSLVRVCPLEVRGSVNFCDTRRLRRPLSPPGVSSPPCNPWNLRSSVTRSPRSGTLSVTLPGPQSATPAFLSPPVISRRYSAVYINVVVDLRPTARTCRRHRAISPCVIWPALPSIDARCLDAMMLFGLPVPLFCFPGPLGLSLPSLQPLRRYVRIHAGKGLAVPGLTPAAGSKTLSIRAPALFLNTSPTRFRPHCGCTPSAYFVRPASTRPLPRGQS
ncbi:hypothetical protein BC628DRAFT_873161 [Trametes gibbosa]|nr:hypothetical protein BC628DRAFT_873161 [Trametes gibbosa]